MIGRIDARWDSTFVHDPEGDYWRFTRTDERSYYGKDHLGNIRLVLNENNQVLNAQDYYPYGEVLRSFTSGGYSSKYLFTEKERDTETTYDYFGARYYSSDIARWLSVDPLADKYPGWSPYVYALNNPLKYIDPNGMYSAETQDGSDPEKKERPSDSWGEGVHTTIKKRIQNFFTNLFNVQQNNLSPEERKEKEEEEIIQNHGLTNNQQAKVKWTAIETFTSIMAKG